jgi:hypothetical protein
MPLDLHIISSPGQLLNRALAEISSAVGLAVGFPLRRVQASNPMLQHRIMERSMDHDQKLLTVLTRYWGACSQS